MRVATLRALALLLVIMLGACSGTTFVYNRLDTVLPWYLDDYVDLSGSQEQQLDTMLGPFLSWHRQQELPLYIALLDQADADLNEKVTPAQLELLYSEAQGAWLRLRDESLDWMLELGTTLSDAQVEEFLDNLQERQQEYEEEYLSRSNEEFREESYDSLLESMQDYLGRLSPEQRERLELASRELRRSDNIWLQERARWLQRLAVIMERKPGWQEQLRAAIAKRDAAASPEYREVYEHNMGVIFAAVTQVLNARSERQDQRLRAELRDLREDLEMLVAEGAPELDAA